MSMTKDTSSSRTAVSRGLAAQAKDERRRALAFLLRRPLVTPFGRDGEIFMLVRRHAEWLREWFVRHCGWMLSVESELARLRKTPADLSDVNRPLLDSKGYPFTRRRYVLLCLALAALEKSERQTVLRRLAEDVLGQFTSDPHLLSSHVSFDLALREHRRDLVEVIRYLMDLGILRRVDGDEQWFVTSQEHDVLYNINRSALAMVLNVRRGPSTITAQSTDERINAIVDEWFPDTDDGRHRRMRTRLFRRLLDDPLVYYAQLEEHERAYLISQRPSIVKELELATGLLQEARKEGLAMVDPDDMMTDVKMLDEGTDGHVTLLIADYLATRLRSGREEPLVITELEGYTEMLIREHRAHWRKDVGDQGAATLLTRQALRQLQLLRLIDVNKLEATVSPLPAIARFALGALRERPPELFEPAL